MKKMMFFLFFLGMTGCTFLSPDLPPDKALEEMVPSSSSPQEWKEVDIPKAIQMALRRNPDYLMVSQRIEQAAYAIMEADSAFYPHVQIYGRYAHSDSPLAFFGTKLEQRKFLLAGNLNRPGDFGSGQMGARLSYQFSLGGAQFYGHLLAKLENEIAKNEKEKILNILVSSIIEMYFDILAAQKYVSITEDSVKAVEIQLQERKIKWKGGSVLKTDVLTLEVELAKAKEEAIRAKNRYRLAQNGLSLLVGLDPSQKLDIQDKEWNPAPLPENYEQGVVLALQNRPEIHILKTKVKQAETQKKIISSGYFPTLELFATYYFEDRDLKYSIQDENWQAGGGIYWNIFDGFKTYASSARAESQKKEALYAYRKILLGIKHEVEEAYLHLEESKKRVEVLSLAVQQAEENFSLIKQQFEGGTVTITRYLEAELSLKTSRFRLSTANYDLKKAKAKVGHALGLCGSCARQF